MSFSSFLRIGLSLAALWGSVLRAQSATAEGGGDLALTFRGFGTLGVARSNTDAVEFMRDVSQPKGVTTQLDAALDSRLGLQVNLRLNENWELVAQAVAKRRFDDTFRPELTWAFLKWEVSEAVDLRAGRLGFDVYQLADSRNVGYSYLWVRPPVEFYGGIPITEFDGADLVVQSPVGAGFGRWKVFGGHAKGRIPTSGKARFDLTGSPLMGTIGDFRQGDWWFRLAYAQLKFKAEFNSDVDAMLAALRDPMVSSLSPSAPALADELAIRDKWVRYLSLGVVFERGPFQSHLGLSRATSQSLGIPKTHAGYLTLGYRQGTWTPYLSFAAVKSTPIPRSTGLPDVFPFSLLSTGVQQFLRTNQNDQRALSLGIRWDVQRNLCLKAQVDDIHVGQNSYQLWWRPSPTWNRRATVATLTLDFVF